jgi:hypothetical protein
MTILSTANNYIEEGSALLGRFSVPQSGPVWLFASAAAWYGRRIALTYAPGFLADYCIYSTIHSMGETVGRVVGTTVVAPAMVPSLVPMAAAVTAVGFWYTAVVIGNLVHLIFKVIRVQWQAYQQRSHPPAPTVSPLPT